jgi:hypothetical protein
MIDTSNRVPGPHVGEQVLLRRDALVEVARTAPGLPPTWRFLPAGTRGRLLGWRDRASEAAAIIEVDGVERRLVVYLGEGKVDRAAAPVARHHVPSRRAGPR